MPLSFGDLSKTEVKLTVETASGPLDVRYRPHALTPQLEAEIATSTANGDSTASLLLAFCTLVSWVDVVGPLSDGDGNVIVSDGAFVPVTPMCISLFPSRLLIEIFQAVQEDMSGGPKRGTDSSGGSFTNN